jgi:hypothetical protein
VSTLNTEAYTYGSLTCGDSGSFKAAPPSNEMDTRKAKIYWLSDDDGGVADMVGKEDDSLLIGDSDDDSLLIGDSDDDSLLIGDSDGTKDGLNVVGIAMGLSEGKEDGADVGSFVGSATGERVGTFVVGKTVGGTVGASVDIADGLSDGTIDKDGDIVGVSGPSTPSDGARDGTIDGLDNGPSVTVAAGPKVCTAVGLEDTNVGASLGCVIVSEDGTAVRVGADEVGTVGRDGSTGPGTIVGRTIVGPIVGSRDRLGAALGESNIGGTTTADADCRSDKNIPVGIIIRPVLHKQSRMTR